MNILTAVLSDRITVQSSNLRSVGYDPWSGTLTIEFHSGKIYEYVDVPLAVYAGLMDAQSHGRFFAIFIRKAYAFRRLQ